MNISQHLSLKYDVETGVGTVEDLWHSFRKSLVGIRGNWRRSHAISCAFDANAVADKAAEIITAEAHSAVAARGQFTFAVSGGQTPLRMLRTLSAKELPWAHVFVFQVDERGTRW